MNWIGRPNCEDLYVPLGCVKEGAIIRDHSDNGSGDGYIGKDGDVGGCLFKCKRDDSKGYTLPRCLHTESTWDIAVEYRLDNDSWMTDLKTPSFACWNGASMMSARDTFCLPAPSPASAQESDDSQVLK